VKQGHPTHAQQRAWMLSTIDLCMNGVPTVRVLRRLMPRPRRRWAWHLGWWLYSHDVDPWGSRVIDWSCGL